MFKYLFLIDINECRHRPCQNDGVCHNTPGFYSCDCEGTGYRGPTCASGAVYIRSAIKYPEH